MSGGHYLGLAGARVIQTRELLLSHRAIRDLLAARAMGALHGPAGSGKTFAAQLGLDGLQVATAWVQFPSRPTMLHVARTLYRELAGGHPGRANRFDLSERLIELLAGRERLLVVDEAQWLTRESIEYLRHLHDQPETRFTLLLVGGDGCWEVLSREPMLRSRMYRRLRFAPMTLETVLEVIPAYHPIYEHAPAELLALIDDRYAQAAFAGGRASPTAPSRSAANTANRRSTISSLARCSSCTPAAASTRRHEAARADRARPTGRARHHALPQPAALSVPRRRRRAADARARGIGDARDILTALGKRFRPGSPRAAEQLLPLARIWLHAERARHLVITRADRRPASEWSALRDLCAGVDAPTLWLIVHRPQLGRDEHAALRGSRRSELSVEELARWLQPAPDPRREGFEAPGEFPPVPDVDFPFFPSACAELLPESAARIAIDTFREGRRLTFSWLNLHRPARRSEIIAYLDSLATPCASADAALALLRGAQAALLTRGVLVRIDPHVVAARHHARRARPRRTPRTGCASCSSRTWPLWPRSPRSPATTPN